MLAVSPINIPGLGCGKTRAWFDFCCKFIICLQISKVSQTRYNNSAPEVTTRQFGLRLLWMASNDTRMARLKEIWRSPGKSVENNENPPSRWTAFKVDSYKTKIYSRLFVVLLSNAPETRYFAPYGPENGDTRSRHWTNSLAVVY